ncbi:MAG: hypothetical protein ACK5AZ_04565 [Bryobacteraceae bacterium]
MDVHEITQWLGPVSSVVLSILLVILGILVIAQPLVLPWLVGIALMLAGVAMLVGIIVPRRTTV